MKRTNGVLVMFGFLQFGIYATFAVISTRFVIEIPAADRPLLSAIGLLTFAFLPYIVCVAVVYRQPASPDATRGMRHPQFWLILCFAVLFRFVLWWSEPFQEIDYYRYLWDGRVLAAGFNPYRFSPATIEAADPDGPLTSNSVEAAELRHFAELTRLSPSIKTIFERIHHRDVPTVYPPVSQLVFAAAAWCTPVDAPVKWHVRVLKAIMLAFDVATIVLVGSLLAAIHEPTTWSLVYAWCPLVVKEFANSAHMDAIAVMLVVATMRVIVADAKGRSRLRSAWQTSAVVALFVAATLAKGYALCLLPILARSWFRRHGIFGCVPIVACLILTPIGYLPFSFSRDVPTRIASMPESKLGDRNRGHDPTAGLREFLLQWEMNDLVFACIVENLADPDAEPKDAAAAHVAAEPWFRVVPDPFRIALHNRARRLLTKCGWDPDQFDVAFLLAQGLTGTFVVLLAIVLAAWRWDNNDSLGLLRRSFWLLAWLWYLFPAQNPWYWSWALPLAVFAGWPWLATSGFALLYYARFWLAEHYPSGPVLGTVYDGIDFFDFVVVWFEHSPPLLLVAASALWRKRNQGPRKAAPTS